MTKRDKKLTAVQHKAASLLAQGKSVSTTAKAVEKSKRTVFRWMKIEEFQRTVDKGRDEILQRTYDKHIYRLNPALDKVFSIKEDSKTFPNVQLRAAQTIIGYSETAIHGAHFQRKLNQLENDIEFRIDHDTDE